ncbi:MAG TPA: hypothetical protein GXZ21_09765 [Clostridiales bacterium]|nr:hypothetical protein [Clostridiales bacterium]
MKRFFLCVILVLGLVMMTSCSKEELILTADAIDADTILAKKNGEIQAATVEGFDKNYYNLNELNEFVTAEIDAYNLSSGGANVTLNELQRKGEDVVMIISYTGMKHYAEFNKVIGAYFNGGKSDIAMDLPDTLINVKNGSGENTSELLQNENLRFLVIDEPSNVLVDGKVQFISDNLDVSNNTIQGVSEGRKVIVFKP